MKNKVSLSFLLPTLIIYIVVKVYPIIQAVYFSFTNYTGLSSDYEMVGLGNFIRLFQDERFLNSIKVTLIFVVVVVGFVNILGLLLAMLVNYSSRIINFVRSIFFLPVLISQVAVAYIWKTIYSYNGLLDFMLTKAHLTFLKLKWTIDPDIALFSTSAVEIWRILGYHMVIILAALQTIPDELYEASSIDGCSPWKKFRHITLPLVLPGLSVSIIMSTMGAIRQFDIVKVLTDGGPLASTETIVYTLIDEGFNYNRQGYASAMGVALFLIGMAVVLLQNTFFKKKEVEY